MALTSDAIVDSTEVLGPKSMLKQGSLVSFPVVAAGHAGSILFEPTGDGEPVTILKKSDAQERAIYEEFSSQNLANDPILGFVPRFHGIELSADFENERLVRMSNVLDGFANPSVMDVKLGQRSFLESECKNTKLRADLFEKMTSEQKAHLTESELSSRAISKHRYLSLRDATSTLGSLGYRIEGVASKGTPSDNSSFRKMRTEDQASEAFMNYIIALASRKGGPSPLNIVISLLSQLKSLRVAMESSTFVKQHECIGTSILFVADAYGRCGISWVDFAKTISSELEIGHRVPWTLGNHEDGLLTGMDSLITSWETLILRLDDASTLVTHINILPTFTPLKVVLAEGCNKISDLLAMIEDFLASKSCSNATTDDERRESILIAERISVEKEHCTAVATSMEL